MVVKNIVNIQNNKLDFDINGTNNSLKYSFRGIEHFRLTEVGGTSHVQFIAQNAIHTTLFTDDQSTGTNADFVGRISNINNHVINNLKDVYATNPGEGNVLVYEGGFWKNKDSNSVGGRMVIEDDFNTSNVILISEQTFHINGAPNEVYTEVSVSSTGVKIGLPTSVIVSGELRVGPSSRSRALITTAANNDVIFRNNDADANSGIVLGSNGEVTIECENSQNLNFDRNGNTMGSFALDGNLNLTDNLMLKGTNVFLGTPGGGNNNDVMLRHQGASILSYEKGNNTQLHNESNIKLTIGTSSRLEVDSTNSVFATDLYIVNKDSEGSLIDNRGGHFHSDGTNFCIAYNNGTNVTNFVTDPTIILGLNNTLINTPTGGNIELTINADTKFLVGGTGGDVFIRNQLNVGELCYGTSSASVNFSVSGSESSRQILFSDVHGSNNFIDLTDTRFRINHNSKVSARIGGQNKLVITSNEIKVDNNANLLVTGLAKVNGNLIVDGTAGIQGALAINGGLTLNGCNLEVGGDTTITGNLIGNGTQTILNTEIKLIEDPFIELGYFGTNSLSSNQNKKLGFFGQYTNSNYAGLYYDSSTEKFRMFDSIGTSEYAASLNGTNSLNLNINANIADLEAKNFHTKNGDYGQEIAGNSLSSSGVTGVNSNFLTMLQSVYGNNNGLYCGKSLFSIYKTDYSSSSSILLNYNFHSAGTNQIVRTAVELETRGGDIDFMTFDSDNNNISVDISSNPSGSYRFSVKLFPILTSTAGS